MLIDLLERRVGIERLGHPGLHVLLGRPGPVLIRRGRGNVGVVSVPSMDGWSPSLSVPLPLPRAGVAQLAERQPSKLHVASSNLVSRSTSPFPCSGSAARGGVRKHHVVARSRPTLARIAEPRGTFGPPTMVGTICEVMTCAVDWSPLLPRLPSLPLPSRRSAICPSRFTAFRHGVRCGKSSARAAPRPPGAAAPRGTRRA